MPRPPESPDVRASKALAYILRHGAEKEGLHIRSDGYIKLSDVLARPKMREIDLMTVLRLVAENAKQRFELLWGYDPSPPRPKKKPVQGPSKKEKAAIRAAAAAAAAASAGGVASATGASAGVDVDAATIDDLRHDLTKASLATEHDATTSVTKRQPLPTPPENRSIELPLVSLPLPAPSSETPEGGSTMQPTASSSSTASTTTPRGEYFIRATQGHSIALESTAHLVPVTNDEDAEGRRMVGEMVHGTKWELWDVLKDQGLSRMTRQHIHLAPSYTGPITPRTSSTLFIHLNLTALLEAGIPVYVSSNGVVLTPGNENGFVGKEFWKSAWRKERGIKGRVIVWENGREVARAVSDEEREASQ